MTDAPSFTQVSSGSALYGLGPEPAAGWVGFWSPATTGQSTLTLDQAWTTDSGVYVIAAQAPSSTADMATALAALMPALSPAGLLRLLWIEDPNDPVALWQTHSLLAQPASGGVWTLARSLNISGGGYGIYLQSGVTLTESGPADGGPYGIAVGGSGHYLFAPKGALPLEPASCVIPFSGAGIGAISAKIAIAASQSTDAFTQLAVMLRYAYPTLGPRSGAVDRLDMPVMSQGGQAFDLYLSYFPGALLSESQSWLAFFPPDGGTPPTPASFPCYMRTVLGYGTTLTPTAGQGSLGAARLVFGASPRWLPGTGRNQGSMDLHLTPDGAYSMATATPPAHAFQDPDGVVDKVMLGASGTEYAGLTALSGCIALFDGGSKAYAPKLATPGVQAENSALLTADATTAAATFLPPGDTGNLTYFAQPRQSPLFKAGDTGFLDYLELPAALLSNSEGNLPLGIYAGIADNQTAAARLLEANVLAPARNQKAMASMQSVRTSAPRASAATTDAPIQGVTPPGLCVTVSGDRTTWQSVILAQINDMNPSQRIFSSISKDLQSAMQADQLFFVVADPAVLAPPVSACPNGECTSVQYRLDQASIDILGEEGVDPAVITAFTTGFGAAGYPTYNTKNLFVAAVQQYAPAISDADLQKTLAIAGQLSIEIDHWLFQLSPDSWRNELDSPTLMLVKYANSSLEELVNDTSRWGYRTAAGDAVNTQSLIQSIFETARQASADTPYGAFYRDVVSNPAWNGFLFLNAPVNTAEMPDELLFLTAGIDLDRFYAHHLAVGATSYAANNGVLVLGQSSISGLIDYNDATDLVMESSIPYAFKTQQLTAVFKNTALVDFKAQCELLVNRLFDAESVKNEPEHGNNLVLRGGFQRQNGAPVYSFILTGQNDYSLLRSALYQVSVDSVQINTAALDDTHIKVSFLLSGKMRFTELPLFDLFSYGVPLTTGDDQPSDADSALAFSNLAVLMQFARGNPSQQTFTAFANDVAFDLSNSVARTASLANRFPIKLTGLAVGTASANGTTATRPEDLGYAGVDAPLDASVMTAPWYGLVFSLDMGSLGALTGGRPLIMSVLAAWCVGLYDNEQPVYLGLKMPDGRPLGIDWPLQGVLHLGFRSFDFVASGEGDQRAYMLRMRRFGLSALGISFPPGNLDVFMFGDPSGNNTGKLGWYAAYAPDGSDKAAPSPHALNARRTPQIEDRLTRTERARRNGRRPRPPNTGV